MSDALTIPPDVLKDALTEAFAKCFAASAEDIKCIDAAEAAMMLGITPAAFRSIAQDHHDFGPRNTRWSLRQIRELKESRRVKAASSKS